MFALYGLPGDRDGVNYNEAKEICAHLSEDGTEILGEKVEIWRACSQLKKHGEPVWLSFIQGS